MYAVQWQEYPSWLVAEYRLLLRSHHRQLHSHHRHLHQHTRKPRLYSRQYHLEVLSLASASCCYQCAAALQFSSCMCFNVYLPAACFAIVSLQLMCVFHSLCTSCVCAHCACVPVACLSLRASSWGTACVRAVGAVSTLQCERVTTLQVPLWQASDKMRLC
jgi:hypothetical protein